MRMSIRALLCGLMVVCCYRAGVLGQSSTESTVATESPSEAAEKREAMLKELLDVLLVELPCSVKDLRKMNSSIPCEDDSTGDASSDVNGDTNSDDDADDDDSGDDASRRKRHAWQAQYLWSLNENRQRLFCPRTDQTNVTQELSADATDYPVQEIARFIIVGLTEGPPQFFTSLPALLASAVIPGRAPEVAATVGLEVRACPSDLVRLFRYKSSTFNTTCWVIQNFEPKIFVNLMCKQTFCSNCRSTNRGYYNLCYPDFQVFSVLSYCPAVEPFPVVTDTLLVPTGVHVPHSALQALLELVVVVLTSPLTPHLSPDLTAPGSTRGHFVMLPV
ncbi:uncharacterized protein LOC143298914 [Babylonia areolata]|uniref:uncharacterized protein LOC143298914 n=1 Tax=Babylonia areolata TaxID=304850 RepID=UPI003FD45B55